MSDSRAYPKRPILAVSALIHDVKDNVLIVRRAKEPSKGQWSLPGGAVKLGESVEDALAREIKEECGITIKLGPLFGVHNRIQRDEDKLVQRHYVILNYRCQAPTDQAITAASDIDGAVWLAPQQLDEYTYTEGVKRVLQQFWRERA